MQYCLTASERRAALAMLTDAQLLARIRALLESYQIPSEAEHRRIAYLAAVSRKKEGR
jgi:hypothetical protein